MAPLHAVAQSNPSFRARHRCPPTPPRGTPDPDQALTAVGQPVRATPASVGWPRARLKGERAHAGRACFVVTRAWSADLGGGQRAPGEEPEPGGPVDSGAPVRGGCLRAGRGPRRETGDRRGAPPIPAGAAPP